MIMITRSTLCMHPTRVFVSCVSVMEGHRLGKRTEISCNFADSGTCSLNSALVPVDQISRASTSSNQKPSSWDQAWRLDDEQRR